MVGQENLLAREWVGKRMGWQENREAEKAYHVTTLSFFCPFILLPDHTLARPFSCPIILLPQYFLQTSANRSLASPKAVRLTPNLSSSDR